MSTKQFWYPDFPLSELRAELSALGFPVSLERLHKPTADFVFELYTAFLEQVTSLTDAALYEPLQEAIASLDDPTSDLYTTSLAQSHLLYHISRLAAAAKVADFNAMDLYSPSSERTRVILCAFVNFLKFFNQCSPFVARLQESSTTFIEDREKFGREVQEIEDKLNTLNAQRANDAPLCETMQTENTEIQNQLLATRESQTALVKDIETLKMEKATVVQSKDSINQDITLITDTMDRTKARIVQSPERLKRTITAMGSAAIQEKKTVAIHENKIRDLQNKVAALGSLEKDIRNCVEQLQTVEKETQALESSQRELGDIKDHLDARKIERNELHMKEDRVQKQHINAAEKLERAQRHAEDKRLANEQTIARLQRQYEQMSHERRQNDHEVDEIKSEADQVKAKIGEHLKQSEIELNELMSEYWQLRHQTEVYMETLANKLGMHVSAN